MNDLRIICWLLWCGVLFVFYAICALWNNVVSLWW